MTSAKLESVAVIGCGLIGGSIAAACADIGVNVFVSDTDERHRLDVCAATGAREWTGESVDLVVVAVPPTSVVEAVEAAQVRAPATPITDVASAKSSIVADIDSPWFIGGHPLAGAAESGPAAADARLFAGRPWVTCARQRATAQAREAVSALVALCGAREIPMTADDHDRAVAVTSHSVQLAAAALAVQWSQLPATSHEVRGRAFDEVMRLAGSSPQLWGQIAEVNAGALAQALLHLADQLTELADGLAAGNAGAVLDLMTQANEAVNSA